MSERMKTVFIIEDEKPQLEAVSKALAQYGFNIVGGETMAQSLELLREHIANVAVLIIDMRLDEFPDYEEQSRAEGDAITGVRLAQRVLRESRGQRPEIMILSAFGDRVAYYEEAIHAYASDYLVKGEEVKQRLLATVQALALKYSFQPSLLNDAGLAQLAEGHANSFEMMSYFCQNRLIRELDLCLVPASYVLQLRNKGKSGKGQHDGVESFTIFSDVPGLPGVEEFDYLSLHRRIFETPVRRGFYVPEEDALPEGKPKRLKDFTFIKLANSSEVEIALGILSPSPVRDVLNSYPFSAPALAEAIINHAAPALESFVEKLIFRWREKQSVKLERVRTLVAFSDSVQRRLNGLLRLPQPTTDEQTAAHQERLQALAQEFDEYSRTLSALLEHDDDDARRLEDGERPSLSDIVQEIKADYERFGYFDEVSFTVQADCLIPAARYYLSLALRELVRWAVERRAEVPRGEKQLVQFRCMIEGNWLEIYFADSSERFSKYLREDFLFEPLSPLHAARIIVEVACHGKLLDVTDEMEDGAGHLFKIRLLHD
jgi:CheY-like chemotaxis protein